nr:hypothetical protein [Corynebacterium sp. UBA5992]
MSNHLELAAWRSLSDQQSRDYPELDRGYYVVDLLEEVLDDPRTADARLNLKSYVKLLGPAWGTLLAKHEHEEKK